MSKFAYLRKYIEMRLSEYEIEVIVSCAKDNFGENTSVIIFGSRAVDIKKGGDIDLLVKPGIKASLEEMIQKKLIMLMELDQKLGEQKIAFWDVPRVYNADREAFGRGNYSKCV